MLPYEIHLSDLYRIFIGNVPGIYFIELLLRCLICYTILVVGIRLMGKRMAAQISRNELSSMVLMAAAIGIPVASPDRGIVPGIIIAAVIVLGERLISKRISTNDKLESQLIGDLRPIVKDGYLVIENMSSNRISRDRIFAELRTGGLKHLGKVKRFYFEADGSFTLIEDEQKKEGLSILPDFDKDMLQEQKQSDTYVCLICGMEKPDQTKPETKCPNCGNTYFAKAIEE